MPFFYFMLLTQGSTQNSYVCSNLIRNRTIFELLDILYSRSAFIRGAAKSFTFLKSKAKVKSYSNHGNIIRTGITCKKNFLLKSIEFSIPLKYSATCYKPRAKLFLVTRPPTC